MKDSEMAETEREKGRRIAGEILGARRSLVPNSFNDDFMEMADKFCYAGVWDRPGLERKSRSILTMGMLIAQGRGALLRLHITGALNNGCTVREIKEVILHASAYCGFPAASDAMRVAEEVLREKGLIAETNQL